MIQIALTCFKAYDVRGKLGEELNIDIAYHFGRALSQHTKAKKVVVGGDVAVTKKVVIVGMLFV
jgi:phosphomannomutase